MAMAKEFGHATAVVIKREIASAIAPATNRVFFIKRAESDQTLLTQSKGEKSKASTFRASRPVRSAVGSNAKNVVNSGTLTFSKTNRKLSV